MMIKEGTNYTTKQLEAFRGFWAELGFDIRHPKELINGYPVGFDKTRQWEVYRHGGIALGIPTNKGKR